MLHSYTSVLFLSLYIMQFYVTRTIFVIFFVLLLFDAIPFSMRLPISIFTKTCLFLCKSSLKLFILFTFFQITFNPFLVIPYKHHLSIYYNVKFFLSLQFCLLLQLLFSVFIPFPPPTDFHHRFSLFAFRLLSFLLSLQEFFFVLFPTYFYTIFTAMFTLYKGGVGISK